VCGAFAKTPRRKDAIGDWGAIQKVVFPAHKDEEGDSKVRQQLEVDSKQDGFAQEGRKGNRWGTSNIMASCNLGGSINNEKDTVEGSGKLFDTPEVEDGGDSLLRRIADQVRNAEGKEGRAV